MGVYPPQGFVPSRSHVPKNNLAATAAPTVNDDSTKGYDVGSRWVDVTNDESYICTDASAGAAAWSQTTVGTIGEVAGLQAALDAKQETSEKNQASGYAGLDASTKLTGAQIPYGSGANTACQGNDARLSDARTPTAHAATHASGGGDDVTLAQSQVTNLTTDLANKQPLYSYMTAIAGLTPTDDDIIQRKAGAWINRTIAQLKADLAIVAAVFYKTHDPISQEYAAGATVLQTHDPASGKLSILPQKWVLPAKVGDVETQIRFRFSDASTITRTNSTASEVTETRDSVDFAKDGFYIDQVEFIANNVGATQTVDLGAFKLDGHQV